MAAIAVVACLALLPEGTRAPGGASRPAQPAPPEQLVRLERLISMSGTSALHVHAYLRPLLAEIASQRLATRGQSLERLSDAAGRDVLGERLWELVRPGRPFPEDRHGPGVASAELSAMLERARAAVSRSPSARAGWPPRRCRRRGGRWPCQRATRACRARRAVPAVHCRRAWCWRASRESSASSRWSATRLLEGETTRVTAVFTTTASQPWSSNSRSCGRRSSRSSLTATCCCGSRPVRRPKCRSTQPRCVGEHTPSDRWSFGREIRSG